MTTAGSGAELAGPLAGLRVVEVASTHAAFAGKLMADLGADVVVVEPPGGHPSRDHGPFLDDEPGPERSLYWWHYNTSKRGVVLDLEDPDAKVQFRGAGRGRRRRARGRDTGPPRRARHRPRLAVRGPPGAHLGVGHGVRARRVARAGAVHRPHAAGRSRTRRGAAGTTTTRSRRCAAVGTRRSTPGACSP